MSFWKKAALLGGILLAGAIIATVVVVMLSLNTVKSWFATNTHKNTDLGYLVRERLASGSFRIIAGVFDTIDMERPEDLVESLIANRPITEDQQKKLIAGQVWECSNIDSDLEASFAGTDLILVTS
jgi:hypothetical protein